MLSWFMKLPVQVPFGNAFYLPRPCSAVSDNPFPSYHIPVTLTPSSTYSLFFATALPQLAWNQQLPHSFYRHRGWPLQKGTSFSHPLTQKRTNHESASTQLQLGRDAGQSRSEMPSRHPLRTSMPPSRHPLRALFSPCRVAASIPNRLMSTFPPTSSANSTICSPPSKSTNSLSSSSSS